MKSFFLLLLVTVMSGLVLSAQEATKQYPGKVKYQKVEQDATIFEVPYPASQVEDGLKELALKQGIKVREKNGFFEARNYEMEKLGGKKQDVYYKVEKNGKEKSKIYLIIAEPGEDLANRTSSHAAIIGATAGGAVILSSIALHLNDHDFNLVKLEQEEAIAKAEKKLADLQDEQSKLQKKLADINKELDRNATEQNKATAELELKRNNLAKFLENKGGVKKKD